MITASETGSPRYASASAFSFWRIIALISGGAYCLPSAVTRTSPFGPLSTSYGTIVISSVTSSNLRPMKRLIEKIVLVGFVTCCRRAGAPTSRWPSFVNATTDGVVRPPSAFGMTVGLAALEHGHARVGRAQIDADGLCHTCSCLLSEKI